MPTSQKETPTGGCNHLAGAITQNTRQIVAEVTHGRKRITLASISAAAATRALEHIADVLERRNEHAAIAIDATPEALLNK